MSEHTKHSILLINNKLVLDATKHYILLLNQTKTGVLFAQLVFKPYFENALAYNLQVKVHANKGL